MAIQLQMKFESGDDGAGELFVSFRAKAFSGESSAWVTQEQIAAFVSELSKYPLDANSLPALVGGFYDSTANDVLQEHIHISAKPQGSLGEIALLVRLAVPDESSKELRLKYSSSVYILTEYHQVSELCRELLALASGELREVGFIFERSQET
jgi:hypothetical protein